MDIAKVLVIQLLIFSLLDITILIKVFSSKIKTQTEYVFKWFSASTTILQLLSTAACLVGNDLVSKPNVCVSYIVFIIMMILMSFCAFCWYRYLSFTVPDRKDCSVVREILRFLPVVVISILSISSPWTHWMFYIDGNGVYQRGSIFILQIVCPYLYFMASVILTILESRKCKKNKMMVTFKFFLIFIIPSAIGAILQILVFKGGYTQIGISIAMILMYLEMYVEEIKENEKLEEMRGLNNLLKEERENERDKNRIIGTLAKMFFCIYDIDMSDGSFIEIDAKNESVKSIIGNEGDAQEKMNQMADHLIEESYVEEMREFTNISTLNKRLRGKTYISQEFVGVHSGWSEGIFIVADRDIKGNCKHIIWAIKAINEIKEKEIMLINNSYTDKLTGLFNRRKFEENLSEYPSVPPEENFLFVSMDVNGLKTVNDTLGHKAGDELLVGASDCMKQCLGSYGRLYRIGGDEFAAILFVEPDNIDRVMQDFFEATAQWSGKYVKEVSISSGYVSKKEFPDITVSEMAKIADRRMYEAKAEHYSKKGMDRRGQQMAYAALCAIYTKIMKVNLNSDSYRIISMEFDEQNESMGFSDSLSTWFTNFGTTGQVHPDDLDNYLEKTNLEYLKKYFNDGKDSLQIRYRRRYITESTDTVRYVYRETEMEMIPTDDYSEQNQNLYLYVKKVED